MKPYTTIAVVALPVPAPHPNGLGGSYRRGGDSNVGKLCRVRTHQWAGLHALGRILPGEAVNDENVSEL